MRLFSFTLPIFWIGVSGYGYRPNNVHGDCKLQLNTPGSAVKDAYPMTPGNTRYGNNEGSRYNSAASSPTIFNPGSGGVFGSSFSRPSRPNVGSGNNHYGASSSSSSYNNHDREGNHGNRHYPPPPVSTPNYGDYEDNYNSNKNYASSQSQRERPYGNDRERDRRPPAPVAAVPDYGSSSNNRYASSSSSSHRGHNGGHRPQSSNSYGFGGNRGSDSSSSFGSSSSSFATEDAYGGNRRQQEQRPVFPVEDEYLDRGFNNDVIDRHNSYRTKHSAPPLKYDEKMSIKAQEHANELAQSRIPYGHSSDALDGIYGENLHVFDYSRPSGASVVDLWYREKQNFDFRDPILIKKPQSLRNSHFTAMIWKASRRIGVGKATSNDGKTYVVVNYWPPGNIADVIENNVLPSRTDLVPPKGTFY